MPNGPPLQVCASSAGSELSRQVPVDLKPDADLNEGRGCPGHCSSSLAFQSSNKLDRGTPSRKPLHGLRSTRARAWTRLTWSITPPLLTAGCQWRLNTSASSTSAGPKMRLLDSVFASCSALNLLSLLGGFVERAMVRVEKSPRATFSP